jgi:hypothetical protein
MKDLNQGFIALFRQFTEWEWYDDANTMRLFIHCLLLANYKDKKWRGKLIKRGSFITSLSKLAHSLKLSKMQIRNSLSKLKTTGEITHVGTPEYSIITVLNYTSYQDRTTHRITDEQHTKEQTSNTRVTTTNKDNKRDINKLISLSSNERDLLKNYILSKPRKEPIYDFDAYLSLLIKNGTAQSKLEQAKKWQEKQEQKKLKVVEPPEKEEKPSPEDTKRGLELLRNTAAEIKRRRTK